MADGVTVAEALMEAIQRPSEGVNAQLEAFPEALDVEAFYGPFDASMQPGEMTALIVDYIQPRPEPAAQARRDVAHRFAIVYKCAAGEKSVRRKNALWTLTALLRAVDPPRELPAELRDADVFEVSVEGTGNTFGETEDWRDKAVIAALDLHTRDK